VIRCIFAIGEYMANRARALLESALRSRKLDRTLTTALPPLERIDSAALVPTGIAALDACLGGGVPRGQVSELAAATMAGVAVTARTAGRTTLLLQIIASATARGELAALVDTCDALDVDSALAAGIERERLLWIRGTALSNPSAAALDRTLDRALKALNLVLQAGGFAVVAIDLGNIPPLLLKRLPATTWLRVQRTVEGSDTACVLLVPEPLARSAGGLTVSLTARPAWAGAGDRSRRLAGLDVRAHVISPRRRVSGDVDFDAVASDNY
jgi:hypothetical protein